jgi:hypothetical protein
MCFDHGVSMEHGDHSRCRIELRACPEHEGEQGRAIAEAKASEPDPSSFQKWLERSQCNCGCAEAEFSEIVGWCLHCTHQYTQYNSKIEDLHFALHCPGAPAELKESAREKLYGT